MMRRDSTSGRQPSGCQAPCSVIHSSTSARALARVMAEFGGAQMAQPAKAQERRRPFVGRRLHLEDRAAVADHDLAGEGKAAGIDFGGARGVGGAQVLRRDQQPVGLERQQRPAQQRMAVDPAGKLPQPPRSSSQDSFAWFATATRAIAALAPSCGAVAGRLADSAP